MRKLTGYANHQCCPREWRGVQNLTGSYELDGMIARTRNRDMVAKLKDYLADGGEAYGPLTAYNGYRNYQGDA
jgi:hypothetical protein